MAGDLAAATPFRRRLEQSRILVVPIVDRPRPCEPSSDEDESLVSTRQPREVADVGPGRWELLKDVVVAWPGAGAGRWLAWPTKNDAWAGYFRRLLTAAGADVSSGGYVTVGINGQVRGSGGGSPAWDVLLSTFPRNRPGNQEDSAAESAWREATVDSGEMGAVDASNPTTSAKLKDIRGEGAARPIGTTLELPAEGPAAQVLALHNAFYAALGRGDEPAMEAVWLPAKQLRSSRDADPAAAPGPLDRFIKGGARMDGWDTVLRPDRRPEGLKLSDVDVTIERNQATVTVLETVANGATLLATQAYERVEVMDAHESSGGGVDGGGGGGGSGERAQWVLRSHFTIPYGKDTVAKIALRCDERGCVALPAKEVSSQAPRGVRP